MSDKDKAAPVGEREAFEDYCQSIGYTLKTGDSGRYLGGFGAELWAGFKAGAAYQRAIAELREECNTLRQQLAERDATIGRLEAGIPRLQEHAHQMRQQRDKLAGLLADVKADYTHAIHWEDLHATMKRIDAALAEVNK